LLYSLLLIILLSLCCLVGVGSPLQYTVGKTPVGGTHKVEFGGAGAERGAIGIKSKFTLIFTFTLNEMSIGLLDSVSWLGCFYRNCFAIQVACWQR